ncbi:MAG TPA: hypothetical protein VNJ06_05065 [Gemmatimonadales bacterium]|nr:hypothetical protein [Gemmatimonadales bacterium]
MLERPCGAMRNDGMRERWNVVAVAAFLSIIPSFHLSAQDTTRTRDTSHITLPADTMHHGVRPMGAFLRSFILPGWGQAATGRPTTGAAFVAWEGVTAMMTFKAEQEANYFKRIHSSSLRLKRQEVQDWLVLWVFNHLFSGAEAYVSGHLKDFPPDLKVRAFPGGIGVSIPLHE